MLTSYDNLNSVLDFKVISMSSLVDLMGVHNFEAIPSRISDHSLLVADIYVCDVESGTGATPRDFHDAPVHSGPPDSRVEASLRGRHSAPVHGATSGGRGPKLPPRFVINSNVPSDFLNSQQSNDKINDLIEKLELKRKSQDEVNRLYDEFVETFIVEMRANFKEITCLPSCSRKLRFTKKEW